MSHTTWPKETGLPHKQGMYDPAMEHDACGFGFIANIQNVPSHEIVQQALEIVYESGSASASMLQRRLRVGYNRAANLIDELERNGVVGPAQGSKPRNVLGRSE